MAKIIDLKPCSKPFTHLEVHWSDETRTYCRLHESANLQPLYEAEDEVEPKPGCQTLEQLLALINSEPRQQIEFAGQTYPNTAALARSGRKAAAAVIQENDDPLGTASDLVGTLLPLIPSADTPHADLPNLLQLVSLILQDGLAAHNRRLGIAS